MCAAVSILVRLKEISPLQDVLLYFSLLFGCKIRQVNTDTESIWFHKMFVKISLHRASCFVHNNLQTKDIYNLYVSKLECWISMQSEIIWACIHIFLLVFVFISYFATLLGTQKSNNVLENIMYLYGLAFL